MPALDATAEPHWELAKDYDLIDFELGCEDFRVLASPSIRVMELACSARSSTSSSTMLVKLVTSRYSLPTSSTKTLATARGQLPDKEGQMYHVGLDNLYLIPTAEVPVTQYLPRCDPR